MSAILQTSLRVTGGWGRRGDWRRFAAGRLEYFFTERYCLFTRNHAGLAVRANIHAVASPLEDAEAEIERNDLPAALGIQVTDHEPVLHYSRRLAVYVWPAETGRAGAQARAYSGTGDAIKLSPADMLTAGGLVGGFALPDLSRKQQKSDER